MYWLAHKNEENTCQVLEDDLGSDPNLESRSQEDDTVCYDNTNHASGVVVKYVLIHCLPFKDFPVIFVGGMRIFPLICVLQGYDFDMWRNTDC